MYSRSYYPTDALPSSPPENYDGVVFREAEEQKSELPYEAPDFIPEIKEEPSAPVSAEPKSTPAIGKGLNIPFLSGLSNFSLGGIFGRDGGLLSSIGLEEILIIAVAAYLLFTDTKDVECAVMLLLLLFVS